MSLPTSYSDGLDSVMCNSRVKVRTPYASSSATITYRYRYAGVISTTTSRDSIPVGAVRLGTVTT